MTIHRERVGGRGREEGGQRYHTSKNAKKLSRKTATVVKDSINQQMKMETTPPLEIASGKEITK